MNGLMRANPKCVATCCANTNKAFQPISKHMLYISVSLQEKELSAPVVQAVSMA